MENVVLIIHLLLALALIGVVLMQRSEGAALSGGSQSGMMSARRPANPLARVTWGLAVAFIITSLLLTISATRQSSTESVLDRVDAPLADEGVVLPGLGSGEALLPPSSDESTPLVPITE